MPRILCFCWNSDQTPLCESYLQNKTKGQISRSGGLFSKGGICYNPLFFDEIQVEIQTYKPVLAVFLTENDPINGSHFHSNFLPDNMNDLGYKLLTRDKYVDNDNTNALRMSIFVLNGSPSVSSVELSKGYIFNDNKLECNRTYLGAPKSLVLYVNTSFGNFAFIGIQVPRNYDDRTICLTSIDSKFVANKNLDGVFLLGDFANEFIVDKNGLESNKVNDLRQKSIIPNYQETLTSLNNNNNGDGAPPTTPPQLADKRFLVPTYSPAYSADFLDDLENDDLNTYYDLMQYPADKIQIGYHDRIFHRTIRGYPIQPLLYRAILGDPMLSNDQGDLERTRNHLGVLGVYSLAGQTY